MSGGIRILLAAGGTGGHMMPAIALARELGRRGHDCRLITDARGAGVPGRPQALACHVLPAGRLSGGPAQKLAALARLAANAFRARRLLRAETPAAVVGFGGYPALATLLAARSLGLPYLLHEQNAVLGRTNRLLAAGAAAIALSYRRTQRVPAAAAGRTALTGLPVREAVAALSAKSYPVPDATGPLRLLAIGGSLGARVLSEVVPAALARLPERLRWRLAVDQQCRAEDLEGVRRRYAEAGIAAELAPFFEDMPARLARAHLVVARAGASTLAELAVAGRPAILVPLPIATDDHQTANAAVFAEAGAGWTIPQAGFTPEMLAEQLAALLEAPTRLAAAAAAARGLGRPDAAAALADLVEEAAAPVREKGASDTRPDAPRQHPEIDKREAQA